MHDQQKRGRPVTKVLMDKGSIPGGDKGLPSNVDKGVKQEDGSDVKLGGVKRSLPQRKRRGGKRKRNVGVTTCNPPSGQEPIKKGPVGVKLHIELRVVV